MFGVPSFHRSTPTLTPFKHHSESVLRFTPFPLCTLFASQLLRKKKSNVGTFSKNHNVWSTMSALQHEWPKSWRPCPKIRLPLHMGRLLGYMSMKSQLDLFPFNLADFVASLPSMSLHSD